MIDFQIEISRDEKITTLSNLFVNKPSIKLSFSTENLEFIAWGDPIFEEDFKNKLSNNPAVKCIIENLYGHYYYILLNKATSTLFIGNSLFSILPVYYYKTERMLMLSNDPLSFQGKMGNHNYSKRFLLESVLFNYPLFNHSCIEGVNLLPANHYFQLNEGQLNIQRHTAIENNFIENPKPWKKSIDSISDLFIETCKKYYPDEHHITALTGGFDGRALTACGLYNKNNFSTYSFGSDLSEDLRIAERLSKKCGLEFNRIDLDEAYVRDKSLNFGLAFIQGCSGGGAFARAHYLYAIKKLDEKTKYIISGNFGSEVLRAAHNAGVLISPNLYRILASKNYDDAIISLDVSPEWDWINKPEFKNEWTSLKEDIKTLSCFNPVYKELSKNQQFYKIVFEEIFRKYFGAEMVNQYRHLANRTPFLDIDFLRGLFGTGLAGVYSDFFTHNPLKRFKGQVLYANIINKTYPEFANELMDKGYKPEDLLSLSGKLNIARSYIKKRIMRKIRSDGDPYAVDAAFFMNRRFWEELNVDQTLFNKNKMNECIQYPSKRRDSLFIALSQAWFYNTNFAT